jgi:hypothetical protein
VQDQILFEMDFSPDEMPVEKDAKIFEAGDYPDKQITVTEDDLDAIVGNFAGAPVKVEHTDSPLDPLGTVKRVWRQGGELFARLAFPSDLAAFLERRGVKKLSVALYKDPLRLAEVSLVLSPRVPSAAMFGEDTEESGRVGDRESGGDELSTLNSQRSTLNDANGEGVNENMSDQEKDTQIRELQFALRAKDVDAKLADLKAQGKIVPASEAYAREILLQGDGKVTFGEGEATIGQMFECFLEAQPKVVTFGELAPSVKGEPSGPLSDEEQQLLTKLGITREQFAKYAG